MAQTREGDAETEASGLQGQVDLRDGAIKPGARSEKAATDDYHVSEADLEILRRVGQAWPVTPKPDLGPIVPNLDRREAIIGQQQGNTYVRVPRQRRAAFRQLSSDMLQATGEGQQSRRGLRAGLKRLRTTLIGDPISNEHAIHERLTKVKALAVLSSDALSSVAYATGQLTAVLVLAGVGALTNALPIAAAIAILLGIVALSYRQTIKAYPRGGGSYIVAKDNLGDLAGLAAGSSLMIDYVLTVAVSITAGVSTLTSIPALYWLAPHAVQLDLVFVALLLLGNLRGIKESGTLFMAPTYMFLVGMYGLILVGAMQFFLHGAHATPFHPAYPIHTTESLSLFLILRAFASGCTALTGVEAISDGVPAFQTVGGQKLTEWKNARTTLTVMAVLAIGMFVGITLLVFAFGLVPFPGDGGDSAGHPTLLAQLAIHVLGTGPLLIYVLVTTSLILALAANTAYSDFPRLSYFMASDGFMPHQFAQRGDRLSYSNGIILLTLLATILIVVFNGNVNDLINLYVIGVFNSFTLSQASMVKRWWQRRDPAHPEHEPKWRRNITFNGIGTVATFVVLLITAITKFTHGAWLVVILVPIMISVFWRIRRHYRQTKRQLESETPLAPQKIKHTILVPVADLNRPALQTLAYARSITDRVVAVHVSDSEEDQQHIREKWAAWGDHVPLVVIDSPYRSLVAPLLSYIDAIDRQSATDTLTIVLPEFVPLHWWDNVLHNQTALRLKAALLFRPGTVVTSVPYHLKRN